MDNKAYDPRHDKTNKVTVRPEKTQISLSIRPVFAVRMKNAWVLSYPLSAQRRLWSVLADAQADLSICWAHSHFVGFVISRLLFFSHSDISLSLTGLYMVIMPFLSKDNIETNDHSFYQGFYICI